MTGRIIVRSSAHRDVVSQAEYFGEKANEELAYRFLEAAEAAYRLLLKHPALGKPSRIRSLRLAGVRELPMRDFEKHIIFYRPVQDGIEVIRVLHGARDLEALLG